VSDRLTFTIFGPITSNNKGKAPVGGRMLKTKSAKNDAGRAREICTVAVVTQRWEIPDSVAIVVTAWNSRLDIDNSSKVPLDGLKGVAWHDDGDVLSSRIERDFDGQGERYEYVLTAIPERRPWRLEQARKKRRAAPAYRAGDPIPDGYALCNGGLIPATDALKMIRKAE